MTRVFRLCSPRRAGVLCPVLLGLALAGCATPPPPVASTAEQPPVMRAPGTAVAAPLLPTSRSHAEADAPRTDADALAAEDSAAGYGMLYFPSAGQSVQLVTDIALNRLYEDALPGYGLYTFVVLGAGFERASGETITRHSELFRMIETYVATPSDSTTPGATAHVFMIPIRAGRAPNAPLMDLAAVDLSNLMRRQLAELLRQRGQARLATRIERSSGPLLIAGLEPSLLPLTADAPRLVADLSALGPEHLYSLVDAYDRDIPTDVSGRPESLAALRQRLLDLAAQLRPTGGSRPATKPNDSRWIFLI